ncbi:MAG: tRNA (N6-threonylcarbamoyladenosine(37)-N6)-methyltransferase TrmO [Oligoflexales bacterium]
MTDSITLKPIGKIFSCYGQKFGIPRQSGLAPAARAVIELPYHQCEKDSVRGLKDFSHIWVLFIFHKNNTSRSVGLVRPPRLGGEKKVGTLASRSPNRPNPIGLSVVRLVSLSYRPEHIELLVQGGDFLDSTPVLDIKPYLPYADKLDEVCTAWVEPIKDQTMPVYFSQKAIEDISAAVEEQADLVCQCIKESLTLDPRPSFVKNKTGATKKVRSWRSLIFGFDVSWTVANGTCIVEGAELKKYEVLQKLNIIGKQRFTRS